MSERDVDKQAAVRRVAARRDRHRQRPIGIRAAVAGTGMVMTVAGLPLLVVPELGLPVLLAGLALLALEFEWAMQAMAWTHWRSLQLRRWLARRPRRVKFGLLVLLAIAVLLVAVWLVT
ncbi:MAG: PGPGW domain-containing protein [Nocardioidaceae bacterium]